MIKIEINNKSYNKIIFNETKFETSKSDFIGIKGKSGSGKSTLLSIIGMLEDFEGNYYINNETVDLKKSNDIRKKYFSYVFQKPFLIPYLSVKENILMPLKNTKEEVDLSLLDELVKEFEVEELLNRKVNGLSGGEAQRISLIRAVMTKREIILCDEPTGSLDPENAKKVMDCLKKINQKYGRLIIMVTHSMEFDGYFNKIIELEGSKINYVV